MYKCTIILYLVRVLVFSSSLKRWFHVPTIFTSFKNFKNFKRMNNELRFHVGRLIKRMRHILLTLEKKEKKIINGYFSWKALMHSVVTPCTSKEGFVFKIIVICFKQFIFNNLYNEQLPNTYFVAIGMPCTSIIRKRILS